MKKSHCDGRDSDNTSPKSAQSTEMFQPQIETINTSSKSYEVTEKISIMMNQNPNNHLEMSSSSVEKDTSDVPQEFQKHHEVAFHLDINKEQNQTLHEKDSNSNDEACIDITVKNASEDSNANQFFEPDLTKTVIKETSISAKERPEEQMQQDPVQSPLVPTPPYEYLILPPGHENKFRIYLNPKINKSFFEILHKQSQQQEEDPSKDAISLPPSTIPSQVSSTHPKHRLPLATSSIVTCFDPSEVDMELKQLLLLAPPVTNTFVRKRPRTERGSSVPAIDSYYGCDDLEKVGHASYFIPLLTPSERKAVGWKDDYKYGRWKYSTPNLSNNIPLSSVPSTFLKSTSSWWRRTIISGQNNNNSSTASQNSLISQSQTSIMTVSKSVEQTDNNKATESVLNELEQGDKRKSSSVYENASTDTLLGSRIEEPKTDYPVNFSSINNIKRRIPLTRLFCWLIPDCFRTRHESSTVQDQWEEDDPTFPSKSKTSESSMEQKALL